MAVYTAIVDSLNGPYYTVGAGITGVVTSGLMEEDLGIITVLSGTYEESPEVANASGVIILMGTNHPYLSGVLSVCSGELQLDDFDIDVVTSTGSGNLICQKSDVDYLTVYHANTVTCTDVNILGYLSYEECDYVTLNHCPASGVSYVTGASGLILNVYSGHFMDGAQKFTIQNVSGVTFDHVWGYGWTGTPFSLIECYQFDFEHCSLAATTSGGLVVWASGSAIVASSGNIDNTIMVASGVFPVSGWEATGHANPVIRATGSCITDYNAIGTANVAVSGFYMSLDPKFVSYASGILQLSANSPCACAADLIESAAAASGDIVATTLDQNAIQFYVQGEGYKATRPSGIYIVQDGKAVYFESDPNLDTYMNVVINTQYQVAGNVKTVSSLSDEKSVTHKYLADYQLIPRMNQQTNQPEYYVKPFTVIPLETLIMTINDKIVDVSVSGLFQNNGFTRDHSPTNDGTPCYWIGEKNNQYLYRFSGIDNEKLETYMLFTKLDATGTYGVVQLQDLDIISKTDYGATVKTNKVYNTDHYETKIITIQNGDGMLPYLPAQLDTYKETRALAEYRDWLYVLARTKAVDAETAAYSTDLYIFNKHEQYPFETPVGVISGVPNIMNDEATDMTLDDEGNLYISSSGQIAKYTPRYDYALITRNTGTMKTTLTFREFYAGAQV